MESALSQRPARSLKISGQNIFYGFIHLIIVTVVSLPTFFYIFHAGHPSHFNSNVLTVSNLTKSEKSHRLNVGNATSINKDKSICNSPLIFDEQSGQCRPPCEWTTQTVLTQQAYFIVIVVGLWVALITTIITFITWACIENLRKFPHVLRFHIIVCCVVLANSKMIPVHLSPKKTFCRGHMFWLPEGQSSIATVVSGALTHCFGLAHAFWSMCYVANTYTVIIYHNKAVFRHPIRIHFMQSLLGWLVPMVIVASCLYFAFPGYKFYFMDLMSAGAASPRMAYFSVTLPMQVTLGVSLCLLWSIVWHLKRTRLDTTKRVIRAPEETASMRRVERQFLSMAGVMLFVLGLVLLVNTVTMYNMDNFVHEAEVYFDCLLSSSDCKSPSYNTVLSLISVVVPSFACIAFFCLLLLNKDCRQIWKDLFQKFKNVLRCCVPHPSKIRADTQRSRCSSTLTVLSERRASEIFSFNTVDPILELSHPYLFPGQVASVKMERARSSTLDLPVMNQKMTVSDASVEIRVTPPSDNDNGGSRVRYNSVPAFASTGKAVQHKNLSAQLLNSQSRDSSATSSNSSLESDLTDEIIQDIDHYTSKL
ncbi:uncharacterized protein [Acropora muricata]|uniref:uncharacterized protein isoform X1 n=1 Tax=Acropora muricata TaxID=159855 RepID=UPI0034E52D2A